MDEGMKKYSCPDCGSKTFVINYDPDIIEVIRADIDCKKCGYKIVWTGFNNFYDEERFEGDDFEAPDGS